MIRLALAVLALSSLPALGQTARCADLQLSLDVNTGGGARMVSAMVRNSGTIPFQNPGHVRVVWSGENGSTQTFAIPGPVAAGAQTSILLGMWPEGMTGTLSAQLLIRQGTTRDCDPANNAAQLML